MTAILNVRKFIASFVVIPYSVTQLGLGTALASSPKRAPQSFSTPLHSLVDHVPFNYGTVQEVYDSKDLTHPSVLLIQDVHLNSEAQSNIARILESIISQQQIGFIGVEGAFDNFDFNRYRNLNDVIRTQKVAAKFLEENLIAAPTYVGITSPNNSSRFIGVDDKTHYAANVEAYLDSRNIKDKAVLRLEEAKKILKREKEIYFSPRLKQFDLLRSAYHRKQMDLGPYVKRLAGHGVKTDFVVDQYLEAYAMERSLDFKQVDTERKHVIEVLTGKLSQAELFELLNQSKACKLGRIALGNYCRNLKRLCKSKEVSLKTTPHFENYLSYILLSDGINADKLFASVQRLEESVVVSLAKSPDEWRLANESEHLGLAAKLLEFSLTAQEWDRYKMTAPANSRLEAVPEMKPFESFYVQADIRSLTMVQNLLLVNRDHPQGASILVTGGFHTPEIAETLRSQKISYAIVSPKITKVAGFSGSQYLSIFAQEKTPLSKLFSGYKLFISPASVSAVASVRTIAPDDPPVVAEQERMALKTAGELEQALQVSGDARRLDANRTLDRYVQEFLDGQSSMVQNKDEILQALDDPRRLSFPLRPVPIQPGQTETDWNERVFYPYVGMHRDFINHMDPAIANELFQRKLSHPEHELAVRQFLSTVLSQSGMLAPSAEKFLASLDAYQPLFEQGVIVTQVEDYSSSRGKNEGNIVNKLTLRKGDDEVSFFIKGVAPTPEKKAIDQGRQIEKYETFVFELFRLLGMNSIASFYHAEQSDPCMTGIVLMEAVPGGTSSDLFETSDEKLHLTREYEDNHRTTLISQFAQFAAVSDMLNKTDRKAVLPASFSFPSNYLIRRDAQTHEKLLIYSIDHRSSFNERDDNEGVTQHLRKSARPEMGILRTFSDFHFQVERVRLLAEYKQAYLAQWNELKKRSDEIEGLITSTFGHGAYERRVVLRSLQRDPELELQNQWNALLEYDQSLPRVSVGEHKPAAGYRVVMRFLRRLLEQIISRVRSSLSLEQAGTWVVDHYGVTYGERFMGAVSDALKLHRWIRPEKLKFRFISTTENLVSINNGTVVINPALFSNRMSDLSPKNTGESDFEIFDFVPCLHSELVSNALPELYDLSHPDRKIDSAIQEVFRTSMRVMEKMHHTPSLDLDDSLRIADEIKALIVCNVRDADFFLPLFIEFLPQIQARSVAEIIQRESHYFSAALSPAGKEKLELTLASLNKDRTGRTAPAAETEMIHRVIAYAIEHSPNGAAVEDYAKRKSAGKIRAVVGNHFSDFYRYAYQSELDLFMLVPPKQWNISSASSVYFSEFITAYLKNLHELPAKVLDMCTGVGPQALATARVGVKYVVGIDIDPTAIATAKENARKVGYENSTDFRIGDLFSALRPGEKFDLMTINPPYLLRLHDHLSSFKTDAALLDGRFELIGRFLDGARSHLNPRGVILLTLSSLTFSQGLDLNELAQRLGYDVELVGRRERVRSTQAEPEEYYEIYKLSLITDYPGRMQGDGLLKVESRKVGSLGNLIAESDVETVEKPKKRGRDMQMRNLNRLHRQLQAVMEGA